MAWTSMLSWVRYGAARDASDREPFKPVKGRRLFADGARLHLVTISLPKKLLWSSGSELSWGF